MEIFPQSKVRISNRKLRKYVASWVNGGSITKSLNLLGDLLESIKIATPIMLCSFDSETHDCVFLTADRKYVTFRFLFPESLNCSRLCITTDDNYYIYDYMKSYHVKKPELSLHFSEVHHNGNKLCSLYHGNSCSYAVELPYHYIVHIILESDQPLMLLNSKQRIENFLVNLSVPCTAQDIYPTILLLGNIDSHNIEKFRTIDINVSRTYCQNVSGQKGRPRTLSSVKMAYGKTQESIIFGD